MNHEVMNIFNPQASQQAFDQIKISIASPEKIMSWSDTDTPAHLASDEFAVS